MADDRAFPGEFEAGMSKREVFAAMAMQALIAASGDSRGEVQYNRFTVAENAVKAADSLISELENGAL